MVVHRQTTVHLAAEAVVVTTVEAVEAAVTMAEVAEDRRRHTVLQDSVEVTGVEYPPATVPQVSVEAAEEVEDRPLLTEPPTAAEGHPRPTGLLREAEDRRRLTARLDLAAAAAAEAEDRPATMGHHPLAVVTVVIRHRPDLMVRRPAAATAAEDRRQRMELPVEVVCQLAMGRLLEAGEDLGDLRRLTVHLAPVVAVSEADTPEAAAATAATPAVAEAVAIPVEVATLEVETAADTPAAVEVTRVAVAVEVTRVEVMEATLEAAEVAILEEAVAATLEEAVAATLEAAGVATLEAAEVVTPVVEVVEVVKATPAMEATNTKQKKSRAVTFDFLSPWTKENLNGSRQRNRTVGGGGGEAAGSTGLPRGGRVNEESKIVLAELGSFKHRFEFKV